MDTENIWLYITETLKIFALFSYPEKIIQNIFIVINFLYRAAVQWRSLLCGGGINVCTVKYLYQRKLYLIFVGGRWIMYVCHLTLQAEIKINRRGVIFFFLPQAVITASVNYENGSFHFYMWFWKFFVNSTNTIHNVFRFTKTKRGVYRNVK